MANVKVPVVEDGCYTRFFRFLLSQHLRHHHRECLAETPNTHILQYYTLLCNQNSKIDCTGPESSIVRKGDLPNFLETFLFVDRFEQN